MHQKFPITRVYVVAKKNSDWYAPHSAEYLKKKLKNVVEGNASQTRRLKK